MFRNSGCEIAIPHKGVSDVLISLGSSDEVARKHWARRELGKAEKIYEAMVKHRPTHADSHFNVGLVRW